MINKWMGIGQKDQITLVDGKMDELSLYKQVLTSTERTWLYNGGQGQRYDNLSEVNKTGLAALGFPHLNNFIF